MRVNVALLNLLSNPKRTFLSLAGIGTAILLIFMQLGFRGAVESTATNIYTKLDFDLLCRSPDYLHLMDSGKISRSVEAEIASVAGVLSTNTLDVGVANWRHPETFETKGVLVLGADPVKSPFSDPAITKALQHLTADDVILMDQRSSPEFGPRNGRSFDERDLGRETEIANQRVRIAGLFQMGAGLAANGAVLVSPVGFGRLDPTANSETTSLILVKLRPQAQAAEVSARIRRHLSEGGIPRIEVVPRPEVLQRELTRWLKETPIGFIFTFGVMISFLVGALMVYMVLANDVTNRIHEYATLRAMGYSGRYLAGVVLQQALWLALFAFLPAVAVALGLYGLTGWLANLSMTMNSARLGFVFALTLVMSSLSGAFALKKLWQAAPAELF